MKKKIRIIIGVVIGVVIIAAIVVVVPRRNNGEEIRTIQVERRAVTQDVMFTGRLQSKQTVNLAFELAGTVQEILVDVGDRVQRGELLTHLNSESAQLELSKARADRKSAVEQKRLTWQKKENEWKNTIKGNDRSLEQTRQAVRDAKVEADQAKEVWQQKVRESGDESSTAKATYSTFLTKQSVYRAAQKALATELKTVAKSNQTARNDADIAQTQYLATTQAAGGDPGISSLRATERIAGVKLSKSVIRAPFDGVVTKKEVEAGEVVSIGQTVLTIETTDALEFVADVPETDAVKLLEGMESTVTFDAFDTDQEWKARITRIAPTATFIEGVPTYETTLELIDPDEKLKPGLTANITVHAAKVENALSIPRRAIITQDGRKFVRVLGSDGFQAEREITTGLVGSDGSVEILQGLSEGELVIPRTPTKEQ